MSPIISIENLSKRYLVGHQSAQRERYTSLRDVLARSVKNFARNGRDMLLGRQVVAGDEIEEFWALKDVSVEIKRGDVVGIIGRNGAGKSTLLKVLSRITEPTSGRLTLRGRVASLLEVGTGFHPELTGRENIFLNGAILGMGRNEIKRKFDEIVGFAEVERFLDTPVKRYSSGMYVRLAFSVAAHLDPEILVVDEVLAVGDATFQKKCLGKMQSVSASGRTILFVSHQMSAITRLCSSAILLNNGRLMEYGTTEDVISSYLSQGGHGPAKRVWENGKLAPGGTVARLNSVSVIDEQGEVTPNVDIRTKIGIRMEFEVLESGWVLAPNYHVYTSDGVCAFIVNDQTKKNGQRRVWEKGKHTSTVWIPGNFLGEGTYIVGAAVSTLQTATVHFFEPDAIAFEVVDSLDGDSARGDYAGPYPGVVRPILEWTNTYAYEDTVRV